MHAHARCIIVSYIHYRKWTACVIDAYHKYSTSFINTYDFLSHTGMHLNINLNNHTCRTSAPSPILVRLQMHECLPVLKRIYGLIHNCNTTIIYVCMHERTYKYKIMIIAYSTNFFCLLSCSPINVSTQY